MNIDISEKELQKLISHDEELQKLFKDNNYICNFLDSDWWLFNKEYFVNYFESKEKMCSENEINISKCKQISPRNKICYRYCK